MTGPGIATGRRWRRGIVAAAAVVVAGGALTLAGGRDEAETRGPYAPAHESLCECLREARDGQPAASQRVFFDAVHEPLHRLAAESAERDRAAAARLLEAKQAVERDFAQGSPNLEGDLAVLSAATRAAIAAAGGPAPRPCPPEANP